ncbi:MAG: transporter [Dorea sp.]|nr:transporter [Dorea sp.]
MPFNTHILKKISLPLSLIFLFAIMLLFPAPVLRGASGGLLLWFNTVLPTLFPFILICNLMISTKAVDLLLYATRPLFCRFFGVSPYGSFAVLSGFLCGYPMGAKVTADLYRQGNITKEEASYLLSFCNNTSPMFILSFLVMQNLKDDSLKLPTLAILFMSPVIVSFAVRPYPRKFPICRGRMPTPSGCAPLSEALDFSIGNALESITKVGVYIMIFAILTELAGLLPASRSPLGLILLSCLEITGGITMLCQSGANSELIYILCLSETAFGGLCAAAQTASMIKGTQIPVSSYLIKKLATALVTSLLAVLYLYLS